MGSLVGRNFALQTAKKDRSLTNFYELLFEFIVQNIQFFFVENTSFYLHVWNTISVKWLQKATWKTQIIAYFLHARLPWMGREDALKLIGRIKTVVAYNEYLIRGSFQKPAKTKQRDQGQ